MDSDTSDDMASGSKARDRGADTVWARGLLQELGVVFDAPTNLWIDNSAAVSVASDAGSVGRSKHIARRARFLVELHQRKEVAFKGMSGHVQSADLLTKPLDRTRFVTLRKFITNEEAQVHGQASSEAQPGEEAVRSDLGERRP